MEIYSARAHHDWQPSLLPIIYSLVLEHLLKKQMDEVIKQKSL